MYEAAIADFQSAMQQARLEGSDADVRALRAELKRAEVELKRSKTKDYYKILGKCHLPRLVWWRLNAAAGVAKDCSEMDIKKAYRRESLKHYPDKVRMPSPSLSLIVVAEVPFLRPLGWRRREFQAGGRG